MGGTPATHSVALAAAPWQRSPGSRFVRLRSRRPHPPNGFARWLPEVAIAPPWSPGGASRAGSPSAVVRRSPWVASPRRRFNRRSPARARVALGNRLAPCRQDMDSVARNHLARLRRDGEPLRGRSHRRAKEGAGTPVASRPQALSRRARSGSPAPCAQAPRTPASPSLSRAA